MKWLLSFLLLLFMLPVLAEETDDIQSVAEQETQAMTDMETDLFYSQQEPFKGALLLSGNTGKQDDLSAYLHLKKPSWQIRGGLRLSDHRAGNMQLNYRDSIVLGAYRLAWGRGLLWQKASSLPGILAPPNAQNYSALGSACALRYGALGVMAALSVQTRRVSIQDSEISYLPMSKDGALSHTREQIAALGVFHETEQLGLGAMYYRQSYNRSFRNAELDSLLSSGSFYLRFNHAGNELGTELILQKKEPSIKADWQMQTGDFTAKIGYSYLSRFQRPAYASKPLLLSTLDRREEIGASLQYKPGGGLKLELATVLNKKRGDLGEPEWLSHSNVRLNYRDDLSRLTMGVKVIDREILIETDSSFVSSKPQHIRFYLNGGHRISEAWELALALRYHYQEKEASLKSGSYLAQHFCYTKDAFALKIGYLMNLNTNYKMLIETDHYPGYEALGESNFRTEADCGYKWKNLEISLRIWQELFAGKETQLMLRLRARLKPQV